MTSNTYEQKLAQAVVVIADKAKDDTFVADIYEPDEMFEYARRCVDDAIEYDNATLDYIIANPLEIISRDISFA
jgi:hypothetical protein